MSLTILKPGDVVIDTESIGGMRVGVLKNIEGNRAYCYWRIDATELWYSAELWMMIDRLAPHPDPDSIIADFTMWRLTNGQA